MSMKKRGGYLTEAEVADLCARVKPRRGMELKNETGALILEHKKTQLDEGWIVLCLVPKNGNYVTWWMNPEGQTFHGHYYLGLEGALEDFKARL